MRGAGFGHLLLRLGSVTHDLARRTPPDQGAMLGNFLDLGDQRIGAN